MSTAESTRKVPDLVVMRHAKSAYPLGVIDHDRPLNGRGARDAQAARQWFAGARLDIDHAWVSSAVRAKETWSAVEPGVRAGATPGLDISTVPELYEASVDRLMSLLSRCTARSLLVVAHNPGLEQLIERIVGSDPQGWLPHIRMKYPTAAICAMRIESWHALGPGTAELTTYVIPRAS